MKRIVMLLNLLICTGLMAQTDGVGIGTTTPLSTLDINGNLSVKHLELPIPPSVSTTAQDIDNGVYISVNPNVTNQIFRLPNPVTFPGRIYVIRNISNTVTAQLTTTAGLLFPKNSTTGSAQIYMFEGNLRTVIVISDGANWTYMN